MCFSLLLPSPAVRVAPVSLFVFPVLSSPRALYLSRAFLHCSAFRARYAAPHCACVCLCVYFLLFCVIFTVKRQLLLRRRQQAYWCTYGSHTTLLSTHTRGRVSKEERKTTTKRERRARVVESGSDTADARGAAQEQSAFATFFSPCARHPSLSLSVSRCNVNRCELAFACGSSPREEANGEDAEGDTSRDQLVRVSSLRAEKASDQLHSQYSAGTLYLRHTHTQTQTHIRTHIVQTRWVSCQRTPRHRESTKDKKKRKRSTGRSKNTCETRGDSSTSSRNPSSFYWLLLFFLIVAVLRSVRVARSIAGTREKGVCVRSCVSAVDWLLCLRKNEGERL